MHVCKKIKVSAERVPVTLTKKIYIVIYIVKLLYIAIIVAMKKFIEFNHVKFETDFFVMPSHIDRLLSLLK